MLLFGKTQKRRRFTTLLGSRIEFAPRHPKLSISCFLLCGERFASLPPRNRRYFTFLLFLSSIIYIWLDLKFQPSLCLIHVEKFGIMKKLKAFISTSTLLKSLNFKSANTIIQVLGSKRGIWIIRVIWIVIACINCSKWWF